MSVIRIERWLLPGGTVLYEPSCFMTKPGRRAKAPRARRTKTKAPRSQAAFMPFGKYRGSPLALVVEDTNYAGWLLRQEWFAAQYPSYRSYLVDALQRTTDADEGPSAA
jgi:hypothetical protein